MGQIREDGAGKSETQDSASAGEHQALSKQLTDEPSASCPQCSPHGKFFAARRRSRQEKVREIYANDEQDQSNGTPQHDERPTQLAADVLLQSRKLACITLSVFRVLVLEIELGEELVGFTLGLRQSHSLLQASNQCQVISVVTEIIHDVGHKEIDFGTGRKDGAEIEGFRQHSYHHHGGIVQIDRVPDDAPITSEPSFPERITQKCNGLGVLEEFFRSEQTSQGRFYTESLKEAFRNENACRRCRLAVPNELEIVGPSESEVAADRLERVILLLEILSGVCRIGFARLAGFRILLDDPYQLLRIAKRQWPQQNRIHHTEDSDVCPYTESKNQNGNDCEPEVAPQHPQCKSQILPQDVDPWQGAGLAMPLDGQLYAAESDKGLTPRFIGRHTSPEIFFHGHFEM